MELKSLFLRPLPQGVIERLHRMRLQATALRYSNDLIRLGQLFKTDKWGEHWYLRHYETHFRSIRGKRLNLLEIGVGGYGDTTKGGDSLRMWKAYFRHSNIFGVDIYDKRQFEEKRIKIFQGSQVDQAFLQDMVDQIGGVDIVIDDGSHMNAHVIRTFEILFPLLRRDGIYVIEDTQTSYWPGYGGSSSDLSHPGTIMGYFTSLPHSINYEEILRSNYSPTEFDRNIVAMHFYHNLIFICKGDNAEGSNRIHRNYMSDRFILEGIDDHLSSNASVQPYRREVS